MKFRSIFYIRKRGCHTVNVRQPLFLFLLLVCVPLPIKFRNILVFVFLVLELTIVRGGADLYALFGLNELM